MKKILIIIGTDLDRNMLRNIEADAVSGASVKEGSVFKTRATTEIAVRMKSYLAEKDIIVEIISAKDECPDLSPYDMIILGSGIYGRQPNPEVKNFISKNIDKLKEKKTAVFGVSGTMGTKNKKKREEARKKYSERLAMRLNPVSIAVFGGVVPESGRFMNWLGSLALGGAKPGDHRDWAEIERWTLSLLRYIENI